ncbi:SDR family oxidoreductase [uncultured Shewanella sp.]|uniref:SDR family oxidoreductase n=1 Tax=uncultured Shewanella sp. TaxID=173975 RepID=UPI0026332666|nr:SDR family oxidoreductase [uncultured Shewanella sp.]
MIAITGANGQLGQLVIHSLLAKTDAKNIVALVRNLKTSQPLQQLGVEVRHADYNQPETLKTALNGVDKLLFISGSDIGRRIQQHKAVIEAAKEANVSLLAYTSILKADTSPMTLAVEHKQTEALIKESTLPATILRNGWYTENYTQNIQRVLTTGEVTGAVQAGKLYTAARKDYAEAAAVVLTSKDHAGKVYELSGDTGFTLTEYAAEISKQTSKNIPYQNLSEEALAKQLTQIGLPEGFANILADSEVHAANGWLAEKSNTLSHLIGRATTPLSKSITEALNS